MKANTRRKLDKFEREQAFMADHAADFSIGTPGAVATAKHTDIINEMNGLAAQQVSGGGSMKQAVGNKEDLFDTLLATLKKMNRAANGFEDEFPGSDLKFRMPRNRSQGNLIATAQAFHDDSGAPLEAEFIEWGLAATFRADLQDLINAIKSEASSADTSEEQKAGATGGLIDAAKRGMKNSGKLDSIVRIKYADVPKTLAAWTVASHLERAPKKDDATPPTPTP